MSRLETPAIAESKINFLFPIKTSIEADTDIVAARQQGRMLAVGLGFSSSDATVVATAISELARNIVLYAKRGEIILNAVRYEDQSAMIITARDQGAGIADLSRAMQDGYSTSGGLGIGLPGVKRLVDEFEIVSTVGKGTVVTATKWQHGGDAAPRPIIRPWQFNKPWAAGGPSLDSRGSSEGERTEASLSAAGSPLARPPTVRPPGIPGGRWLSRAPLDMPLGQGL